MRPLALSHAAARAASPTGSRVRSAFACSSQAARTPTLVFAQPEARTRNLMMAAPALTFLCRARTQASPAGIGATNANASFSAMPSTIYKLVPPKRITILAAYPTISKPRDRVSPTGAGAASARASSSPAALATILVFARREAPIPSATAAAAAIFSPPRHPHLLQLRLRLRPPQPRSLSHVSGVPICFKS